MQKQKARFHNTCLPQNHKCFKLSSCLYHRVALWWTNTAVCSAFLQLWHSDTPALCRPPLRLLMELSGGGSGEAQLSLFWWAFLLRALNLNHMQNDFRRRERCWTACNTQQQCVKTAEEFLEKHSKKIQFPLCYINELTQITGPDTPVWLNFIYSSSLDLDRTKPTGQDIN